MQLINPNSNRITNMSTQAEKISHDGLEIYLSRDQKESQVSQKRSSSENQNAILFQSTLSDLRKASHSVMKNDSARMSLLSHMYSGQKLNPSKVTAFENKPM